MTEDIRRLVSLLVGVSSIMIGLSMIHPGLMFIFLGIIALTIFSASFLKEEIK